MGRQEVGGLAGRVFLVVQIPLPGLLVVVVVEGVAASVLVPMRPAEVVMHQLEEEE